MFLYPEKTSLTVFAITWSHLRDSTWWQANVGYIRTHVVRGWN